MSMVSHAWVIVVVADQCAKYHCGVVVVVVVVACVCVGVFTPWRATSQLQKALAFCTRETSAGMAECFGSSFVERFKANVVISHAGFCRPRVCDFWSSRNVR